MSNDSPSYASPVHIPFSQVVDTNLHIQIANPDQPTKPIDVLLDTGSTGLVVPASFFFETGTYQYDEATDTITGKLLPGVVMGGKAQIKYQPSTDDINGYYFTVPKLVLGSDSAVATTTSVKAIGAVLKTPFMLGIGFGRPVEGDNLFLSIAGMAGDVAQPPVYPSFLLTTKGIWLGCTPAQANSQLGASTFGFQKLTYTGAAGQPPNSSDWSTPTGYFRVSKLNPTDTTPYGVLLDTGVDLMMVKCDIPEYQQQMVSGSTITVVIPGTDAAPILSYTFEVTGAETIPLGGQQTLVFTTANTPKGTAALADPMAPLYVVPRGTGTFVNTGFNVLRGYQLYFDALIGQVGYATYPA